MWYKKIKQYWTKQLDKVNKKMKYSINTNKITKF